MRGIMRGEITLKKGNREAYVKGWGAEKNSLERCIWQACSRWIRGFWNEAVNEVIEKRGGTIKRYREKVLNRFAQYFPEISS